MDAPTWIYLVRHGETDWNVLGRLQGQGIIPLNPLGQRQAEKVAARLAQEPVTALYSSDSVRTMQTAAPIARATGLDIRTEPRLRERDVGLYQGHTWAEVEAVDPDGVGQWRSDPLGFRPPGGENRQAVTERARAALDDIAAAHPGERVVVVSHGGPITMIMMTIRGTALSPEGLGVRNTSVTVLRGRPGQWEEVLFNDVTHLNGAGA
jgi:probable phosphoglycerate mutase